LTDLGTSQSTARGVFDIADEHPDRESLILLAALSVLWLIPQNPEARLVLQRYRERKHSLEALRETALQILLLAGFQVSLEAAFQIRDVFGTGLPGFDSELDPPDTQSLLKRGYHLQSEVYRESVDKLRSNLSSISPELEKWSVLLGYGLVMSRPGLPPHWRELFEVVVLAVQGFPRQLHSHFRGALNLGASPEEVELVLKIADLFAQPDRSQSAWRMWRRIEQANPS
jgi:4-carboxymuconolactone decarboxylase